MPKEIAEEDEQEKEESSQEQDILGMSDEDILNMPPPTIEQPVDEAEKVDETEEGIEEEKDETVDDADTDTEEDDESDTTDEDSTEDVQDEDKQEAVKDNKEEDVKDSELDYKAEYEKLIAPFRANGKDMQISNVDDAITLMQQGANYNKKMAGLKPNLKLMKMLENNELLDESKLAFLIDLNKKNPEAVQKFIKDSGLDPLEIDTEGNAEYTPGTYTVDDTEVELDSVLDDIRDTKSFNETIDIISNKWDASSKKVLLEQPSIIGIINEHVSNGVYAKITQVVENERMLGRLKNLSDLEAYRHIGDAIQAKGGFNKKEPTSKANEDAAKKVDKPKDDPKLKNRKRAASSTKQTPRKKGDKNFNPLALSDEEFEKVAGSPY